VDHRLIKNKTANLPILARETPAHSLLPHPPMTQRTRWQSDPKKKRGGREDEREDGRAGGKDGWICQFMCMYIYMYPHLYIDQNVYICISTCVYAFVRVCMHT